MFSKGVRPLLPPSTDFYFLGHYRALNWIELSPDLIDPKFFLCYNIQMTYDDAEVGFAVTGVLEPELSFLVDVFHAKGGEDSLAHFVTWINILRNNYV